MNKKEEKPKVVVAGHICIDIIPELKKRAGGLESILIPGKLVECGPAVLSTGGAVSNTGRALHRLGFDARLTGKTGDDAFGRAILDLLRSEDPKLAESMIVARGEATSYSMVVSFPGVDRIFIHCPGANDTFTSADIPAGLLEGASLFHFGYPTIMKKMYENGGAELEKVFRKAKKAGLVTSLDMSRPDPDTAAGKTDWAAILERVLPYVDVFLPSFEEIVFMLDRKLYRALERKFGPPDVLEGAEGSLLCELTGRMTGMGATVAGIKIGDRGLCVRGTTDAARLKKAGVLLSANAAKWRGRMIYAPCFQVKVAGATGSGDSTIAGFLSGLLEGASPETTLATALAVGACSVEKPDAVSGIPGLGKVRERIKKGWRRHPLKLDLKGWRKDEENGVWLGPDDVNY